MDDKKFLNLIEQADQLFSGWDFSFVEDTGRIKSGLLSWSYGSIVVPLIMNASSMLDMGTGGGELLSKLKPFPNKTAATEAYPPNVPIAKDRLTPLGVQVIQIKDDHRLPFADNEFDLIINKHESYSVPELKRILAPDGIFFTQQVGGTDSNEINQQLEAPVNNEYIKWNMENAVAELSSNGFQILDRKEEFPIQRFYDVGALVYYLKAIPWQVTDFSVEKYLQGLYKIHQIIEEKGYFDVKQHRFMILAKSCKRG